MVLKSFKEARLRSELRRGGGRSAAAASAAEMADGSGGDGGKSREGDGRGRGVLSRDQARRENREPRTLATRAGRIS